jgi:hypothetical protein
VAQGEVTWFRSGAAEVIARMADGGACGLHIQKDEGRALLLGFGLNHMFDYQVALVRDLAGMLGVRPAIETHPDLQVCLRANDRHGFLFLANYHDEPRAGRVRMVLPGERRASVLPARGTIGLAARRCYVLPLNLPLRDGSLLRYSTAEVLEVGVREGEQRVVLTGMAGAEAEVEMVTDARSARLDGRRLGVERRSRRLRVRLALNGEPQTLVLR